MKNFHWAESDEMVFVVLYMCTVCVCVCGEKVYKPKQEVFWQIYYSRPVLDFELCSLFHL